MMILSDVFWLTEADRGTQFFVYAVLARITVLLALAWIAQWVFLRYSPYLRVYLWRAVVVGVSAIAVVSLLPCRVSLPFRPVAADASPTSVIAERTAERAEMPVRGPQIDIAPQSISTDTHSLEVTDDWQDALAEETLLPVIATPAVETGESADVSAAPFASNSWQYGAAALWVAGAAVCGCSWLFGVGKLRGLYRRATAVPADIDAEVRQMADRFAHGRTISVRHSAEISTAISFGVWQPRILVPTDQVHEGDRMELRATLAHEVSHGVGGDLWWNQLMVLMHALLWFHPLVWSVRLVHADACDEVCDARAAAYLGDSKLYGCILARIALKIAGLQSSAGLAFARRSQVRKRVEVVQRNTLCTKPNRSRMAAMFGSVVSVSVVMGLLTIGRAPAQTTLTEPTSSSASSALEGTTEPGATLQLYSFANWDAEPKLEYQVQADDKGNFAFGKLPPQEEKSQLWLVAKKQGFASKRKPLRGDDASPLEISLDPQTASLSGVITDHAGLPVAGARVTTQHHRHPIPGVKSAITDEDGRFRIDDLASWTVESTRTFDPKTGMGTMQTATYFYVTHPRFPRTRGKCTRIPQQVELQLLPPAIVEGTVFDLVTGKSMPEVGVQAQGIAHGGWYTVTSDDEGRFQLRMTGDHYNIWAVAADRMPLAIKALEAVPGERLTGMDVRMTRGGFIEGTVVDAANNQPVDGTRADLRVAHYGPARPKTGAAVTSTPVGPDGSYRLHVAPGRNYIYLMDGSKSAAYVGVGDGETVQHDILRGLSGVTPHREDADEQLGRRIREQARRAKRATDREPVTPDASTLRPATPVATLLTVLDEMNSGSGQFQDIWANQLRTIAAFGDDAVPELMDELDRTDNDMMLRSMAFILRAIDDKRAVPALIRAIPKTLRPPGSDMGLTIRGGDETLLRFVQQHDLDGRNTGSKYSFGRPVREVFGTLQSLTGQRFGEQELYSIFLNDNDLPSQKHAKRLLYHRVAQKWAQWWNEHAHEFTNEDKLPKVVLPPLPEQSDKDFSLESDTPLKTASGSSNWILQSARRAKGGRVFYDLDTGRATALPKRWRDQEFTPEILQQTTQWARESGYDLMGDEILSDDGEPIFVLRSLGMHSWELPKNLWKTDMDSTSIAKLQAKGQTNDRDLLLHFDTIANQVDPLDVATFFYRTSEGTPGILYVGIQVHDDSLKPGGVSESDNELNPVAFHKGRRFAFKRLVLAEL